MSIFHKLGTMAGLVVRGDMTTLRRQCRRNFARARIHLHRGHPFVHHDAGFPFVCLPEWPDSVDQFCEGTGDYWEFSLLRQWLEPGDLVIDGGANLGMYTFAAASWITAAGRVVAIEAAPYVVQKLQATAELLGTRQVMIAHGALTDVSGPVKFYVASNGTITGEQSLRPEQGSSYIEVEVPGVTLRELTDRLHLPVGGPSVVKLDIEGGEAAALAGTPSEWLGPNGPLWIVEINPRALGRFGAAPADVLNWFKDGDFERWALVKHPIDEHTKLEMRPLRPGIAARWDDSLYYNLFAVPRGARFAGRHECIRRFFP